MSDKQINSGTILDIWINEEGIQMVKVEQDDGEIVIIEAAQILQVTPVLDN